MRYASLPNTPLSPSVLCLGTADIGTKCTEKEGHEIFDAFIEFAPPIPLLNAIGTFVITTASFALLYKILPNVDIAWRDVWVGAAVTALLFALGRNVLGFYLSRIDVGSAFEAAGALAVTLIAIYYLAQIFLLGALLTKVYAFMFGSKRGCQLNRGQR